MNSEYRYTFTIFTPTFNRAHTLHHVYESLKAQTFRDFEWLIIDDGSTDETPYLVEKWAASDEFPIRYIYQDNSGMHIAFNRAVENAKGRFFAAIGSDDACVPTALERFKYHWDAIDEIYKDDFATVTCLSQDEHGKLIGARLPKDVLDSDALEMKYKHRIPGDRWGCHRTEILRQFPMQETREMGSFPWSRMARLYRTRYVNEILEIYYQDTPDASLSRSKKVKRPMTGVYRHADVLNEEIDWFWTAPKEFLRSAAHYVRFSLHARLSFISQWSRLRNRTARGGLVIAIPVGIFLYWRDKLRH